MLCGRLRTALTLAMDAELSALADIWEEAEMPPADTLLGGELCPACTASASLAGGSLAGLDECEALCLA